MNEIEQQAASDKRLNAHREIIRASLDAIISEIGMAMRDVGLTFPVYITVRNSGDALVTIATSLDPLDEQWQHAREIVCRTLEERIGCGRLQGRELACAIANAGAINAADVTAE
jgi:acetone carboxylase gamma subunit